ALFRGCAKARTADTAGQVGFFRCTYGEGIAITRERQTVAKLHTCMNRGRLDIGFLAPVSARATEYINSADIVIDRPLFAVHQNPRILLLTVYSHRKAVFI